LLEASISTQDFSARIPTLHYQVLFTSHLLSLNIQQHVFPWDYKTAELNSFFFNFTTEFLEFFAWLGWATELKTGGFTQKFLVSSIVSFRRETLLETFFVHREELRLET
jgi:hypothetical protein